jgi:hypothetical protein
MITHLEFHNRYMLLQAFDLLGIKMFGDHWDGHEAWARPSNGIDSLRERHRRLQDQIEQLGLEIAPLRVKFNSAINRAEQDKFNHQAMALQVKKDALYEELRKLPNNFDTLETDQARFERRERVHNTLWEAAVGTEKNRSLNLYCGLSVIMELGAWSKEPGFRLNIGLSMVRAPRRYGSRRGPVSIEKAEFEHWLKSVVPIVPSNRPVPEPTLDEQVGRFIQECISENFDRRKPEVRKLVKEKFPALSGEKFKVIWGLYAPKTHTKGGRRKAK